MKLSQDTIQLLKNFSQINQSILIRPGNVLSTVSVHNVILAEATVTETFESQAGIYDLNKFLNCLSMVPGGEVEFEEANIKISDESSKMMYRTCDPSVIKSPPDKKLSLPTKDVCFTLEEDVLQRAVRTSSILGCPDISFIGDRSKVLLSVHDKKNSGSNSLIIEIGDTESEFNYDYKVENLKVLPGNYDVVVSGKDISMFTNHSKPLAYYIALEPTSDFNP